MGNINSADGAGKAKESVDLIARALNIDEPKTLEILRREPVETLKSLRRAAMELDNSKVVVALDSVLPASAMMSPVRRSPTSPRASAAALAALGSGAALSRRSSAGSIKPLDEDELMGLRRKTLDTRLGAEPLARRSGGLTTASRVPKARVSDELDGKDEALLASMGVGTASSRRMARSPSSVERMRATSPVAGRTAAQRASALEEEERLPLHRSSRMELEGRPERPSKEAMRHASLGGEAGAVALRASNSPPRSPSRRALASPSRRGEIEEDVRRSHDEEGEKPRSPTRVSASRRPPSDIVERENARRSAQSPSRKSSPRRMQAVDEGIPLGQTSPRLLAAGAAAATMRQLSQKLPADLQEKIADAIEKAREEGELPEDVMPARPRSPTRAGRPSRVSGSRRSMD